jgi:hypothetical protein
MYGLEQGLAGKFTREAGFLSYYEVTFKLNREYNIYFPSEQKKYHFVYQYKS